MTAKLDTILATDFGDLSAGDIALVRSRRAECQAIETGLSYLRRMVQGRMDIVAAEHDRRRTGAGRRDLDDLISRLPEVLAEKTRSVGNGRLPDPLGIGEVDEAMAEELDDIASPGALSDPSVLTDADLDRITTALAAYEQRVSGLRRQLFDRIDALEDELTRRYRSGEATVDGLLH
jgi:hypothetical protein